MSDNNQELPNKAVAALERGRKIEAIKHVRMTYGIGLKEAKETVEQFLEDRPDVRNRISSSNSAAAKNTIGWGLIIMLVGFAAYYFL